MNRLILRSLITASLLLVLLSVPSIASADSILWTITGVPGVTGSFIFNGTTYSNISIITPLNPTAPGYTGVLAGSGPTATGVALGSTNPSDLSGPVLTLMFGGLGLPTNPTPGMMVGIVAGVFDPTTLQLTGSGEFTCLNAACFAPPGSPDFPGFTTPTLIGTGGDVFATVVSTPEPSALSLLVMGLVTLLAGVAVRKGVLT